MTSDPALHPETGAALDLARRCAQTMWNADPASKGIGMRLVDVAPGWARLTMPVADAMLNGHGVCHGGFIATLADSAFAFACNTYDDITVAAGFSIEFVSPARAGDLLTADARERVRRGRSGVYDVTITQVDGTVVAEYRGRSHATGRPMIDVTETIEAAARAAALKAGQPGTGPAER